MKRKRIIWLVIIVLVVFFSVMVYVAMIPNVKQGSERLETSAISIKQNQPVESGNRSGFPEINNITHAKTCIEQWRLEIITLEEALHCIDRYIESTK